MTDAAEKPAQPAARRPGVLSLTISSRSGLYSSYMPYLDNGGLFIPTSRVCKMGDEVFILLQLMNEPNKFSIAGRVAWITPQGAQGGKTPGIGVRFGTDDACLALRSKIESLLAGLLDLPRPTKTL